MPHEAMTQLSKHVGKSPEAIRQIRLRALKKLESYVRDNLRDENAT
jgi:DNA-directed RNA polymerase sigma subunit (sigma70/sigma32)